MKRMWPVWTALFLIAFIVGFFLGVTVAGAELVTIRDDQGNMQMLEVSRGENGQDIQVWNYSKPTGFVTGTRQGGTDTYHDYGNGRNVTIDGGKGPMPILIPGGKP